MKSNVVPLGRVKDALQVTLVKLKDLKSRTTPKTLYS